MIRFLSKFGYLVLLVFIVSCGGGGSDDSGGGDDDGGGDGGGNTPPQQSMSHNAGLDCMNSGCHNVGNGNNPVFYSAGTIYNSGSRNPNTGAKVNFYVKDTNTLITSLSTDGSGNFYSTNPIEGLSVDGEIAASVNVEIESAGGAKSAMPGAITEGSCSKCHGRDNGVLDI